MTFIPYVDMSREGTYEMTLLSEPHYYYSHFEAGMKVNATLDGYDPICIALNRGPRLRWLFKVFHKNAVEVLDIGPDVIAPLKTVLERVGQTVGTNILITRQATRGRKRYVYHVSVLPSRQFDDHQRALIERSTLDLNRLTQPSTPRELEVVLALMQRRKEKGAAQ